MATKYVRKLLFSIFIDGEDALTKGKGLDVLAEDDFPQDAITKEMAASKFSHDPRVEQVGFYYDSTNNRGVFVGVADAGGLIEITAEGKPQLVGMTTSNDKSEVVERFVASIVQQAGLGTADDPVNSTWVVVPLDELGSGFGTLHLGGMAGISGG